jgi:hypothetical protein
VPKVLGGTKTVPLCALCHGKVHGTERLNHSQLVHRGMWQTRERTRRHGYLCSDAELGHLFFYYGFSRGQIAHLFGVAETSIDKRIYNLRKRMKKYGT